MSTAIQETKKQPAKVLLIDDDEAEFHLVSELLSDKKQQFQLVWVDNLKKGIEHINAEKVDVVLLDLFLGDSRGLETFKRMKELVKNTPIVILSGLDDEQSAVDAIQQGAQDFLVKDTVDGNRLSRVIQYAIKRNEAQKDPKNVGLIDTLTGLYNRRGFFTVADLHLKAAQRAKLGFFVCFAILNDLPNIIEQFGAAEGDHAVLTASEILRESFRSSDLIARVGPDEFAILTADQGNYSPNVISSRIKTNQKYYNAQFNRYRLTLSMCAVPFEPSEDVTVDDLSKKADAVFGNYRAKKNMDQFFLSE